MSEIGHAYLDEVKRQFRGHKRLAEGALAQIGDEEFFRAPDAESNSVALIVKHMAGNLRSRFTDFLTSDGEKPWRHRDQEFESPGTREELMQAWEEGWKILFGQVGALTAADLLKCVTIRGEEHTVLKAINRALAHMAYHTGQVVFLAKHWREKGFQSLSIARGMSETANAIAAEKNREQQ